MHNFLVKSKECNYTKLGLASVRSSTVLPYKPYEQEIRARYRLIVALVLKEMSLVTCKEVSFPHFIVRGVVSLIKFATNKAPGKIKLPLKYKQKTYATSDFLISPISN
jgi:hypothetical protein